MLAPNMLATGIAAQLTWGYRGRFLTCTRNPQGRSMDLTTLKHVFREAHIAVRDRIRRFDCPGQRSLHRALYSESYLEQQYGPRGIRALRSSDPSIYLRISRAGQEPSHDSPRLLGRNPCRQHVRRQHGRFRFALSASWHTRGLLPLAIIFSVILWAEKRAKLATQAFAIVVLRTGATNLADLATQDLRLGYGLIETGLSALLIIIPLADRTRGRSNVADARSMAAKTYPQPMRHTGRPC